MKISNIEMAKYCFEEAKKTNKDSDKLHFFNHRQDEIEEGLNLLEKHYPWCRKCDGYGWTVNHDVGPEGQDEDVDCDCGQDRFNQKEPPRKLNKTEQAAVDMLEILENIKDNAYFIELPTDIQDDIEKAITEGQKW